MQGAERDTYSWVCGSQIFEVPGIVFGLSEVWIEIKNKKIKVFSGVSGGF